MAILRYPIRPPVPDNHSVDADGPTKAIDYLAIRRSRIKYEKDTAWYGENIPNNDIKRTYNDDAVYLAMPAQLQTQYNPAYQRTDVGVAGVMAASLVAGDTNNLEQIAQSVQAAAQGGLPEFATSTIASAANSLNNVLGLAGNVSANSLSAMAKGKVFNPFTEQIFNSMAFRTHVFNFKFLSRDRAEAVQVKQIIDYIKTGSGPILMGGDVPTIKKDVSTTEQGKKNQKAIIDNYKNGWTDAAGFAKVNDSLKSASKYRFMEVPDKFHLKFMRLGADGNLTDGNNEHGLHFRMHTSVCTGVNVNYTPDGQYTTFKDIAGDMVQVPAIQMTVSFTETRMVTQRDMQQGY